MAKRALQLLKNRRHLGKQGVLAMPNMDTLENYNGIAPDTRSEEEKAKDYTALDGLGMAVVAPKWEEKTSWTTLSLRRQITSSSCGAQSLAKILEAFNQGKVMSATPPYHFRSNFPSEGMFVQNIGDIGKNKKTTTEALCKSQNMTESEMNLASIPTERPYGISAYYFLPIDADMIAIALEKGHGVIFGIGANIEEWTDCPKYNGQRPTFNHYVACVPKNYTLHDGQKSFIIDDSVNAYSTIDGKGQRILTETFLKERCWTVFALIPDVPQSKPTYTFTKVLKYGQTNADVKAMQEILIYEKFLKSGLNTSYFGDLTATALKAWQVSHKVASLKELEALNGKQFGPKSMQIANKIYS